MLVPREGDATEWPVPDSLPRETARLDDVRTVPRWRMALRPALLAMGLMAAGFALRFAPEAFDRGEIERLVIGHGLSGELLFVAAAAAGCAAGLPRQAAAFAGGYAFGVAGGTALALLAQGIACVANFAWARVVARNWAARRMRGRLARFDAFLAAHPFRSVLTLRLLPVGNNLAVNLLAGVSRVRLVPFLAASLLGYIPQTVVFALLGGGVRVSEYAQLGLGIALFLLSMTLGFFLMRASRRNRPPLSEAA